MSYWFVYFLILIGITTFLMAPFFLFRRKGRKSAPSQTLIENISLSLLVLFLTFMALEFGFKLFFAQSDGFRYTLASQNWFDRYWQQNSLGYRDREWTPEQLAGKTRVMVVGDSFVAGNGIADPEDRFANQLGQLLGNDFAVMVVASPGWDTLDEIDAIVEHPFSPDILILSYFINDIEGTAYARGWQRPQIRRNPPGWLEPLIDNSHALNFLYWRLIRLGPQEWAAIYWEDWLKKISEDPNIRWRHRQELLTIIEGAAAEQIPLFVVVFPNLAAIEESRPFTEPVIDLFREHNVPVLDVGQLLAGYEPSETMVNAVDSHPNEMVNLMVAEELYQLIQN